MPSARKDSPDPSARPAQPHIDLVNPPPTDDPGHTTDATSPRLPHERDQSTDMTGKERDPVMEQAYRDVTRGLQDTDRGPTADKAYQRQK